jgi:hypothetical protein
MSTAPSSSPAPASKPGSATPAANRTRQIVYALAIVLLFTAMYPYSEWLNRIKDERDLGEATLGRIDTGSFMMKMALIGGARGVVANTLWSRALELQRMHEWDELSQTVNFITKLQPHFLAIWTFQGWNLAYNVSVEWDDPADKYEWIKKGINFVRDGVQKNRNSPDLLWDTAWTYYHKLGFADEAVILRKLVREDEDENFKLDPLELEDRGTRVPRHDNFQLAYGWFTTAVRLVDRGAERLGGGTRAEEQTLATDVQYVDKPVQHKGRPGDLAFRTMPAHAQTRYAAALEKASVKGYAATFGDKARDEWEKARAEWVKFGTYPFPAFSHPDQPVQLDWISWHASGDPRWNTELTDPQRHWVERWSNDHNYRYWKDRCSAEGTRQGVEARRLFYEGTVALKEANFPVAAENYRAGLELFQELLSKHDAYREDQLNKKDVVYLVKRYALALRQIGQPELPKDAPFYELYELYGNEAIPPDPYDALEVLGRAKAVPTAASGAVPGQP